MASYLKKLWNDNKALLIFGILTMVMCAALLCDCAETGVVDPEVVALTTEAKEAFDGAYQVSEDFLTVQQFLSIAKSRIQELQLIELSDMDKDKCNRVLLGIASLVVEMDGYDPNLEAKEEIAAYVRQRSKSLGALTESIGRYDHSDFEEVLPEEEENAATNEKADS